MILRVRPNPITAAFDLRVFEDACSSNTPSTGTWARVASATKRFRRRSSWSGRNRKKSGTNTMGARNPRTAETAVPRTHPTSHHQGVVARSQRSTPPTTIVDPRPRANDFPRSFIHPPNVCVERPIACSHRNPPTYLKGTSAAAKTPNSTARNVTTEAHPGQSSDRMRSRHAAAPPDTRMPAITPKLAVRTAPNRNRFDRRRRATACRSSSNPQASTPIRSLPELRIRARIHEDADRVRRGTGFRDDDPVRRHEGLRERHGLAFSREDANEVAGPNVSGELRNPGDHEVRPVTNRIDRGVFDDHPRQMKKEVFDRPEKRPNRGFVPVFLPVGDRVAERIERARIRFSESRRARSTKVDQVPAYAERVTDVRGERPHIGPGFTSDSKEHVSPFDLDRLKLVHDPRALLAPYG